MRLKSDFAIDEEYTVCVVLCSLKFSGELSSLVSCHSVWRPTRPASCELADDKSECCVSRIHATDKLFYQWRVGEWTRVLADTAFVLILLSPPVNELVLWYLLTCTRVTAVLWYMLTCTRVTAVFFAKWIKQNVFSQAVTIVTTRSPLAEHNLFSAGV
jgi:hypothetical protein